MRALFVSLVAHWRNRKVAVTKVRADLPYRTASPVESVWRVHDYSCRESEHGPCPSCHGDGCFTCDYWGCDAWDVRKHKVSISANFGTGHVCDRACCALTQGINRYRQGRALTLRHGGQT